MTGKISSATAPPDLSDRIAEARLNTDRLFQVVRPDSLYERTIPERHRILFYLGHLEAFDWNLLAAPAGLQPFRPEFDRLFAFGIDPVDGGLPDDVPSDWPAEGDVRAYCAEVRKRLDGALEAGSAGSHGPPLRERTQLLHVALEHRLMHAETLAYILHHLPAEKKLAQPDAPPPPRALRTPGLIPIPSGTATLGLRRKDSAFGWDNEFEGHSLRVPGFHIEQHNVTNAEFLEFLDDGGYHRPELWDAENWEWRSRAALEHPYFWVRRGEGWHYRGMFGEIPLPPEWPVYVSHAEAGAYAAWKGRSLPTEAEFHRAAYGTPEGGEREYPWGDAPPAAEHGNFDFRRWDPVPVGSYPVGDSAFGVSDLLGNGWEWTDSLFEPFAGFEAFPFYPGYSANFFDGKHRVLKGGCSRTAACMLRRSFRNWFQPRYPYIYAAFRCVKR